MLGDRLVVGHKILDLATEVRILVPQPEYGPIV